MTEPGKDAPAETGGAAGGWRAWPPVAALARAPVAGVAVLLLFALLVLQHRAILQWGAARYAGLAEWVTGPRLPGVLAIEPPQLYTRERLVNDRFRQANWLEAQLENTTGDEALTAAARPTASERTDRRSLIGVFLGGDGADGSGNVAAADSPANGSDIAASRALALKEIDRLRLSLRTELMDTLLDDGHDLQGNTLYRLNFDAVVMPFLGQRSYPGTAIFVIEARNPFASLETCLRKDVLGETGLACSRDTAADEKALKFFEKRAEEQVADDLELLRNWQREIQQFLTRVVEARTRDFLENGFLVNPVDPKESIALDWYLRLRLIEAYLDAIVRVPEIRALCDDNADQNGCKEWLAAQTGFAWSADARVPDLQPGDDIRLLVEKGFRSSLEIARLVNQVRIMEGSPRLSQEQLKSFQDSEYKQALVRLILVWQELGTWFAQRGFSGDAPSPAALSPGVDQTGSEPDDRRAKLFAVLRKFGEYLPQDAQIETLREETRQSLKEELVEKDGFRLRLRPIVSGVEKCERKQWQAEGNLQHLTYYQCLMLYASASMMTTDLIGEFVLQRLRNKLAPYDEEDRSIEDFLNVSLEGCAITGCRIQVQKYRDVSYGEIVPPRHAVTMPDGYDWPSPLPDRVLLTDTALADFEAIFAATDWTALSVEDRHRLQDSRLCLSAARKYVEDPVDRAEVYFACTLRHWVDTKRSPLTVYGVSPRAGEGDDLLRSTSRVEEQDRVRLALADRGPAQAQVSGDQVASRLRDNVLDNPSVIGFSNLPDETTASDEENYDDTAIFGWAIRPQELPTGGYSASHHRLSAVVSLPSWWKRVEFLVHGCWVTTAVAQRAGADVMTNPKALCVQEEEGEAWWRFRSRAAQRAGGPVLERRFEIKLPRRVEEVTARFNFDFIKAPYYYQEFDEQVQRRPGILTLEAGRSGQLALAGERLWRGTVVTVNNQTADRIVVLPDMKGVVAQFDCVNPPAGSRHFFDYAKQPPPTPPSAGNQGPPPVGAAGSTAGTSGDEYAPETVAASAGSQARGKSQTAGPPSQRGSTQARQGPGRPRQDPGADAPLFVWTSEGRTQMRIAKIMPFVQRYPDERPCWSSSGP